jgi:hypothetical protein
MTRVKEKNHGRGIGCDEAAGAGGFVEQRAGTESSTMVVQRARLRTSATRRCWLPRKEGAHRQ